MQITAMTPALAYGRGYTGVTNSRRSDSDGRDHLRAVIRSHGSGGGHGVREVLRPKKEQTPNSIYIRNMFLFKVTRTTFCLGAFRGLAI